MKAFYLIPLLFITISAFAQLNDDFESYSLGPVHSGHWGSWSGNPGAEDAIVTDIRSLSGNQAILIEETNSQPPNHDAILNLGNKSAGTWILSLNLFIPQDSSATYNFQETVPVSTGDWASSILFNTNAYGMVQTTPAPGTAIVINPFGMIEGSITYPENEWFEIEHIINLAVDSMTINLNGTEVYNGQYFGQTLGGVNIHSADSISRCYIDDINFAEVPTGLGIEEQTLQFRMFPNPVSDHLIIETTDSYEMVQVFDIHGKLLMIDQPSYSSTSIDVSGLASGIYMVRVVDGTTSGTKRLIVE